MNPNRLAPLFRRRQASFYGRCIKRPLDFCAALILLPLLLPLLLLIILLLVLLQGGNPFFLQTRIGHHCQPFRIIKFRTMSDKRDEHGTLLPDEERTSRIGKLLRACSLDELPEILNVLKGDMSFIGPRPWIPEKLVPFSQRTCKSRMDVRPGISGLAQIAGRNHLTYRQRVSYDLRYIRNLSFLLDVRIFFYTLHTILKHEGLEERADALCKASRSAAAKAPNARSRHNDSRI